MSAGVSLKTVRKGRSDFRLKSTFLSFSREVGRQVWSFSESFLASRIVLALSIYFQLLLSLPNNRDHLVSVETVKSLCNISMCCCPNCDLIKLIRKTFLSKCIIGKIPSLIAVECSASNVWGSNQKQCENECRGFFENSAQGKK